MFQKKHEKQLQRCLNKIKIEEIFDNAKKLSNSDETERLKMEQESLEHISSSIDPNKKKLIYEEEKRLAKEIEESVEKEKKE